MRNDETVLEQVYQLMVEIAERVPYGTDMADFYDKKQIELKELVGSFNKSQKVAINSVFKLLFSQPYDRMEEIYENKQYEVDNEDDEYVDDEGPKPKFNFKDKNKIESILEDEDAMNGLKRILQIVGKM